MSFAHGANDVANAVGPFAASYYVYTNLKVPSKEAYAPIWVMALGATGLVLGLATYGANIMCVLLLVVVVLGGVWCVLPAAW